MSHVNCLATCAEGVAVPQPGYNASPAWLRQSFLMTSAFTVAQHALSCVAHIFSAVSARLSHTIWLLDYAGIALINLHNAPAVIFIGWPQLGEPLWCWWLTINLFATVLIFGRSLHLTLTYQPTTQVSSPFYTPRQQIRALTSAAHDHHCWRTGFGLVGDSRQQWTVFSHRDCHAHCPQHARLTGCRICGRLAGWGGPSNYAVRIGGEGDPHPRALVSCRQV